jgi:4-amino-4-deoxy-L-arabinose transferase-like glycosyltransferase
VGGDRRPSLNEESDGAAAASRSGRLRELFSPVAVAILVFALAVRLALVPLVDLPLQGVSDPHLFFAIARSISRGDGYPPGLGLLKTGSRDNPSAARPPAYPLFLASAIKIGGPGANRARTAQALALGALLVALIGILGWQLWGRRIGLWSMGIAAAYPPFWVIGTTLMSEALLLPLMVAALAAAVQQRRSERKILWAVVVGVLVGLMALTRPNALIVVFAFALAAWSRPRSARSAIPALTLILVTLVTIVPWSIRNAVVFHAFVPLSTQSGFLLAGTYNPTSAADSANWLAWRPPFLDPATGRDLQRKAGKLNELGLDRDLRRRAYDYILDHPLDVPRAGFWNTYRMAGLSLSWNTGSAVIVDLAGHRWLNRLNVGGFWILAALALVGGALTGRRSRPPALVIAVPALFYVSAVFVNGELRFRLPVDVCLIFLAAIAADRVVGSRVVSGAGADANDARTRGIAPAS